MTDADAPSRRDALATLALLPLVAARAAPSLETITYLLPAPRDAIVFAPFVLADAGGRYARAGLAVRFETVPGGAAAGRALGEGRGTLGGAVGDTALSLRADGVPVRGVALLGQHSFLTLMTRAGLKLDAAALRGKRIGVPSRRDTSFYALGALLRREGLTTSDVTVRDLPPPELIAALGRGDLDGVIGTVDWGVKAERTGVALDYRPLDPFYPALAQAVLASDATVRERSYAVRAFVRATLHEIDAIVRDPHDAARRYTRALPASGYTPAEVARVFGLLSRHVYGRMPGRFDPARMEAAAAAAVAQGLAPADTHAAGSYTNAFAR